MAGGCSGGPFAGHNATKARFHTAQVKGGGIKVWDGVHDHPFNALATDLHRRNTLMDCSGHCATGGTKDASFLVNEI